MKETIRILLTNDDGYDARGMEIAYEIARSLSDDIWIIAPATEQSATSRSVSLHNPVRAIKKGEKRYAVTGTPSDSVIVALCDLMKDNPPDLIISGVNRGQNMAEDITFSGTVAAAFQGMEMGVPSIALSLAKGFQGADSLPWETAVKHGPKLIRDLLETPWPKNTVLNVNFPDRAPDEVAGIEVTSQGKRDFQMQNLEKRHHPRGGDYYWLTYGGPLSSPPEGTDLRAIYEGRISITPLQLNLTDQTALMELKGKIG